MPVLGPQGCTKLYVAIFRANLFLQPVPWAIFRNVCLSGRVKFDRQIVPHYGRNRAWKSARLRSGVNAGSSCSEFGMNREGIVFSHAIAASGSLSSAHASAAG